MRNWTQKITIALILVVLATFIPADNVEAKTPAKLNAKDFAFTRNGKKTNFIKMSKSESSYYYYDWKVIDQKNAKTTTKSFKTNRKVSFGSSESYVKKQYGKTTKVKVKKTEQFYKFVKYGNCGTDTSAWKNYLEYNYKKGGDRYKIRFYLDNKNKVTAISYIKNLSNFWKYPNKEATPGLSFQAPNGEKITTKKINGKTVYIVPRGTKIKMKKAYEYNMINMYDIYGERVEADDNTYVLNIEAGESYDLEEKIKESHNNNINTDKLGKYLYFTLEIDDFTTDKVAPAIYYFRFK